MAVIFHYAGNGRSNWVHCIVGYRIPLLCCILHTVVCLSFKYLLYFMYYDICAKLA